MRARDLVRHVAVAALLVAPTAGAAEPLAELLQRIAPAPPPSGGVAVTGRIEVGPQGAELVVNLEPHGAAKLVADPGITVTPLPTTPNGEAPGSPVELVDASVAYLRSAPELRVPVRIARDAPVTARVDYAYCLVDSQCLFGEALLRVEPDAAMCTADVGAC